MATAPSSEVGASSPPASSRQANLQPPIRLEVVAVEHPSSLRLTSRSQACDPRPRRCDPLRARRPPAH
eukprot:5318460-Heterocapsa_arctica.AAC.1